MKNILQLVLILFLLQTTNVSSQSYLGYFFVPTEYGIYTEITGGTISAATGNDGAENINLPFPFEYMGMTYTTARISVNGWLEMGQTYTGVGAYNELESTVKKPLICPLWEDLYADSQSEIRFKTSGVYPARFFVVQWKNVILSSGDRKSFQIRLWEIDGTIDFIYGPGPTSPGFFDYFSVGMNNHIGGPGNFISVTIEDQYYTVDTMVANNTNNDVSLLIEGMLFSFVPASAKQYAAYLYQTPDSVIVGNPDQKIFAIIVTCHAGGVLTSPWVSKFSFNTNGTTNTDDILNSKLFTTDEYPYFSTNNQLGPTYPNPNGLFEIGGFGYYYLNNNRLTYFWLAYDISPNATIGNFVDANCYRIDMEQCCPSMIPDTTLATAHCIISNIGIQGNFTVGASEDFENLYQALDFLGNNILSGQVTLELTNNYNPATEVYPITISRITNASETNTVTIKTTSQNEIIFQSDSWRIFHFKESGYVIIDGLDQNSGQNKIKIINNSSSGSAVYFSDGSSFNIVKNCELQAMDTSASGAVILFHELQGTLSLQGNQILNCIISKNQIGDLKNGILFKHDLPDRSSQSSIISNVIKNCTIKDFTFRGISLENNLNSFHIIGNSIFQTYESSSSLVEGIYLDYGAYPPENPDIIEGNKIYNLQPKNIAGNSVIGIRLPGGFCVNTFNNFISLRGNDLSIVLGMTFASYGYYSILNIYYNSILIYGINSSDSISAAFCRLGATTSTKIKDNILMNYRTSTLPSSKNYCLYFDNDNALPELDNNNYYYTAGSGNFLSHLEGIDVNTLNEWINLTSRDFNSSFTDVTFVSDIDLHLTGSSIGDSLLIGTPISGITTDIDGEPRHPLFPYKGADEVDNPVFTETVRNLPVSFSLSQNYPNPFNPVTKIQYAISSSQFVTLKVYDVLGNEIATLVNEEKRAGIFEVEFNAVSSHSGEVRNLPSGIYFYQLKAGDFVETKKMVLLR